MPEPTTFDIVQTAMSEAAEVAADTASDTATPEIDATPETAAVIPDTEAAKEPAKEEVAAIIDDPDKEWTDLGLTAPKPGQRENRLPHSRVRKMIETERKKLADAHALALKENGEKLTKAEERAKHMDAVDKLINENEDEYMRMLAAVNPKFQRFLTPKEIAREVAKAEEKAAEPRPAPDATFADGSKGYSAEGLDRLLAWQEQQAVDKATKQFNARLEPIEKERQAREKAERDQKAAAAYRESQIPIIRAHIAIARETWGELFTKNENAIEAVMKAEPTLPFDSAVAKVLVPLVQANRDTMRADLLKEINGRPAAAVKTPVAAVLAGVEDAGAQTPFAIVQASMRAAGLK